MLDGVRRIVEMLKELYFISHNSAVWSGFTFDIFYSSLPHSLFYEPCYRCTSHFCKITVLYSNLHDTCWFINLIFVWYKKLWFPFLRLLLFRMLVACSFSCARPLKFMLCFSPYKQQRCPCQGLAYFCIVRWSCFVNWGTMLTNNGLFCCFVAMLLEFVDSAFLFFCLNYPSWVNYVKP